MRLTRDSVLSLLTTGTCRIDFEVWIWMEVVVLRKAHREEIERV